MARPKKETIETTNNEVNEEVKIVTEDVKSTKVEKEKDDKDERLAIQAEQIANLQAQLEVLMKAQANTQATVVEAPKTKRKMIKIISLVSGTLVLQGSRVITLDKQFDSVTVTDNEARLIISNMPNSARDGIFYIADADFVEENNLEDVYLTMLNDKQLKTLLSKNAKDVLEIYQNAPDAQKRIIDDMIKDGRLMGVQIDANILMEIGKINGVDYLGMEKIEDVVQ